MAIHAYDELYLPLAQNTLGHAVDYAVMTLDIEPDTFGEALAMSMSGRLFATGNPSVVAGLNGCEFARMVLDDARIQYADVEDAMYLDKSPEYWAGWSLAYYQWQTGCTFMDVLGVVGLDELIDMYSIYHEMDIERFVERVNELRGLPADETRLRQRRTTAGLSQAQLATYADVSLRQIQLFEQRRRDINKAAAITVFKLSRALCCRVEDLLELN